jgi:sugar phosphate isomerase/epimerase
MTLDYQKISRRDALTAFGVLALSCHTTLGAASTGKGKIALQMYTLREPAKKDLADTLKKVRAMGWEYVQWSGMPNLTAEQIRAELDKAGLKAIAAHTGMEPFETDFDTNVKFWKTVGLKELAPGGMMNDCKANLEVWLKGAKRLDDLGAKLRAVGMRLSYHNHSWEFEKFPGDPRAKLDILMEATKPENLYAELDLAWVFNAKVDPAAYIRKYKGRCPVLHIKDIIPAPDGKKAQFKPLGQGALNWKEIFAAAKEVGTEWYIYEQDGGEGSPFDYTQASYEFLSKNVK